jgi:GGDEF domain-containing protein
MPGVDPDARDEPALPGRDRFEAEVRGAAKRRRSGDSPWVGVASLEGLAIVSARAGRRAADELVRKAAARMRSRLREGDKLAKLGDGRFGLIVNAPYGDEAMAAFDRLIRAVGDLAAADPRFRGAGLAVGVAQLWTADASTALAHAERALARALRQGGTGPMMSTGLR